MEKSSTPVTVASPRRRGRIISAPKVEAHLRSSMTYPPPRGASVRRGRARPAALGDAIIAALLAKSRLDCHQRHQRVSSQRIVAGMRLRGGSAARRRRPRQTHRRNVVGACWRHRPRRSTGGLAITSKSASVLSAINRTCRCADHWKMDSASVAVAAAESNMAAAMTWRRRRGSGSGRRRLWPWRE